MKLLTLFRTMHGNKTPDQEYKLFQGKFHLDIRKVFCIMAAREMVQFLLLIQLHTTLNNLIHSSCTRRSNHMISTGLF